MFVAQDGDSKLTLVVQIDAKHLSRSRRKGKPGVGNVEIAVGIEHSSREVQTGSNRIHRARRIDAQDLSCKRRWTAVQLTHLQDIHPRLIVEHQPEYGRHSGSVDSDLPARCDLENLGAPDDDRKRVQIADIEVPWYASAVGTMCP